jgi:hypothetical protein
VAARGTRLHQYPHRLVEGGYLLALLSPGNEHRLDDRCYVVTIDEQSLYPGQMERHASSPATSRT